MTLNELKLIDKKVKELDLKKEIIISSDVKVFLIVRTIKLLSHADTNIIKSILYVKDENLILIKKVFTNESFMLYLDDLSKLSLLIKLLEVSEDRELLELYGNIFTNKYILENRTLPEILKICEYINKYSGKRDYAYQLLSNPFINNMRNLSETLVLCDAVLNSEDIEFSINLATNYEVIKNETTDNQILMIKNREVKDYNDSKHDYIEVSEYISKVESEEDIKKLSFRLRREGINYFNSQTVIQNVKN